MSGYVTRMIAIAASLIVLLTTPLSAVGSTPGRFGVGDSIMLSSSDELGAFDWTTNAEVGRQFSTGVQVVRRRAARGTLPKRVIVHLGTNGPIDPADCDALVAFAGSWRRVFLVTVKVPRGWQDANNEILRGCAAAHEKVHLIRWHSRSTRHPEWFASDGYHLNAGGQLGYAAFLERRVDAILEALRAR